MQSTQNLLWPMTTQNITTTRGCTTAREQEPQAPTEPGISCAYIWRNTECVNSQCLGASSTQTISWPVPLFGHGSKQLSKGKESCSAELQQQEQHNHNPHTALLRTCKELALRSVAARMEMEKVGQWERQAEKQGEKSKINIILKGSKKANRSSSPERQDGAEVPK